MGLIQIKAASRHGAQTVAMPPSPTLARAGASPAQLLQAPHRLMFFIGAGNLLLAMLWWALWLASTRWPGWAMPQPPVYAGWLHAFVMQYLVLPSFMFGFLLTVFPRWIGLPELQRWQYVPIGAGLMGGQLAILLGACGWEAGFTVGLWMALAGWIAGLVILGRLLLRDENRTWHARSCYAGLLLGGIGVLAFIAFALGASATWVFFSIKLGTIGLLLPVYITVAHRMFPFFAASALQGTGYQRWQPLSWLALVWGLLGLHLVLELTHAYRWLWLADLPLLVVSSYAVYRWWPRTRMPGLLAVLFIGMAWLPVTFALYVAQSVVYLLSDSFILGRAPQHALFIGFFGSLLVAMVTRVTQGHSGRPLLMPAVAWYAFIAIQFVAALRVAAELLPDMQLWQVLAAIGWLLAFLPWVTRIGIIYLSPRADGRPG